MNRPDPSHIDPSQILADRLDMLLNDVLALTDPPKLHVQFARQGTETISIQVTNRGAAYVHGLYVYNDDTSAGTLSIGHQTLTVPASGAVTIPGRWLIQAGETITLTVGSGKACSLAFTARLGADDIRHALLDSRGPITVASPTAAQQGSPVHTQPHGRMP